MHVTSYVFLFVAFALMSKYLIAGESQKYSYEGIISLTAYLRNAVTPSSSTIAAAGTGLENCLTDLSLFSTTLSNVSILNGSLATGTTFFGVLSLPANTLLEKSYSKDEALCGGKNTQTVIVVSSGSVSMNYRGFIRQLK